MRYMELVDILMSEQPSEKLREKREELASLMPEFGKSFYCDQENIWHPYNVFEHTLRVVDGVDNKEFSLRLAALFHDVGKPFVKKIGDDGQAHYYGHWDVSKKIFKKYKDNFYISSSTYGLVCDLIEYHDLSIKSDNVDQFIKIFSEDEIDLLFLLKKADILAQNMEFAFDRLDDLEKQKDLYYATLDEKEGKTKGGNDYNG